MNRYPITYNETCISEVAGQLSALWEDIGDVKVETLGACRFCGQVQDISRTDYIHSADANEYASRHCSCPEAKRYGNTLGLRERAEQARDLALKKAEDTIEEMFGEEAEELGRLPVKQEIRDLILGFAALVYDRKMKDASINLTSRTKVKIAKSSKDNLTFERTDKSVSKQEINE